MKKLICCLLAASLLLLLGCDAASKEVTIDSSFVIVAADDAKQAALSLQTTIAQHTGLQPELVTEAGEGANTITVAVDAALAEGEYRTRIVDGNLAIEAQSELALVMAMRTIRLRFIQEGATAITLTAADCEALSGTIDTANAPFLVLTQNIRYADDEGGNSVIQRAPRFNKLVQEYLPDILCIQEDNRMWVPILQKQLGGSHSVHGMYSGGPEANNGQGGNYQSILYRTERYELLEQGGFWLSDTPTEPTKLEGSKSIRSCTWVLIKDKLTAQTLFVCNTHLDNTTEELRIAQLNILLEQVGSYMEQYPTVFCGDFNARPDSGVYQLALKRFSDPQVSAKTNLSTTDVTFTRYGTAEYGTDDEPRRLDYLFYNDKLTANLYRIMNDTYDGYISDHFGATAEYSFVK